MATVTQKEIAEKLGVTRVLVSRALAGHASVAERTQLLVQETARELGYHDGSNAGARALAARRNGRQVRHGVLACALGQPELRQHLPYWAQLQQGVEEAAQHAGYRVVLVSGARDCEGSDGLIQHGQFAAENFTIPVVNLMEKNPLTSSVTPDNVKGARLATEHLLQLGHTRIACLMDTNSGLAIFDRVRSWRRSLKRAGVAFEENWFRELSLDGGDFLERGRWNMEAWLREDWKKLGCTALLAQNDRTAIGAMQALQAAKIRVPHDVSIIGFDGTGEGEFSTPRLSTIQVPLREIGRASVEILLRRIESSIEDSESQSAITHRVLPVRLLAGESSGPVRSAAR